MSNYEIGSHITLTRGFKLGKLPSLGLLGQPVAVQEDTYDRSFVGSVLEVLTVDLPFIVVRELIRRDGSAPYSTGPFALSVDEVLVKSLSESFVQTML